MANEIRSNRPSVCQFGFDGGTHKTRLLTCPTFYIENEWSSIAAERLCWSSPASRVAYSVFRHSRNRQPGIRDEPVQRDLLLTRWRNRYRERISNLRGSFGNFCEPHFISAGLRVDTARSVSSHSARNWLVQQRQVVSSEQKRSLRRLQTSLVANFIVCSSRSAVANRRPI